MTNTSEAEKTIEIPKGVRLSERTFQLLILDWLEKIFKHLGCILILLIFILGVQLFIAWKVHAAPLPGPYHAEVLNVYDGDTFTVRVHPGRDFYVNIWPGLTINLGLDNISIKTSVRLRGVDTPELRGKCEEEKVAARLARAFTIKALEGGATLTAVKKGKYAGRVIATVTLAGGEDLAEELIAAGLGRAYDGGKREGWCDE